MIYRQQEINLHSHTFYCGHGQGTPAECVQAAKEDGRLKVMGIAEHAPRRGLDGKNDRMDYKDLGAYTSDVKKLKEETTGLKILLGAECEWFDEEESFFRDELLGELGYDYLISGIHFFYDDMGKHYIGRYTEIYRHMTWYVNKYTKALESGMFIIGCHPDLFATGFPVWNQDAKSASTDIIQCAKELNIPLEMNDLGLRKPVLANGRHPYTVTEFWEMAADAGVNICTNSDSHSLKDIYCRHSFYMAKELGIKFVDWKVDGDKVSFVPAK